MKKHNNWNSFKKVFNYQMAQMFSNKIYLLCGAIIPLFIIFFFTSMMQKGLPSSLPIAIVDQDNTATTRKLISTLNSIQEIEIIKNYSSSLEARKAMQRGDIYGYFLFPQQTTNKLLAQKQPIVSFYYNSGYYLAGSFSYKAMKTMATLANASVGATKLSALGFTQIEIKKILQPIVINTHIINNPTMDYNVYLTTTFVPASLGIFIFLLTVYSLGIELKKKSSKHLIKLGNGNIFTIIVAKMLPQTLLFCGIITIYLAIAYGFLHFPLYCEIYKLLINNYLFVIASQGFGIFLFSVFPSLRMAMSVASLWAMLSFTICGFTFPVEAMASPLQGLSFIFPMRHYFMIYQMTVLNGYEAIYAWNNYLFLIGFALLPLCTIYKVKEVMQSYEYIE